MAASLLQSKAGSGVFAVTLDNAVVSGTLLLSLFTRNDNGSDPSVSTTGWARVGSSVSFRAHSSFGDIGNLWYKFATGDERTVTWTPQQGEVLLTAWSGLDSAQGLLSAALAFSHENNASSVSLASGAPGATALVIGGIVTRLTDGTLTPTSVTSEVEANNPQGAILYGRSLDGTAITLTATQAGNTQDGYWWGMQMGAFAEIVSPGTLLLGGL